VNHGELPDGRRVDTASEEWRTHCHALTLANMNPLKRRTELESISAKRGEPERRRLAEAVRAILVSREAASVVALATVTERRAYLDGVQIERGWTARHQLETEVLRQWAAKRAA
jgi:hypothetical protein